MNKNVFEVLDKKYIDTSEGRVYYWTSNRGFDKTLVFLHGLTADHSLFEKQIPHFLNHYNIICWDAPLHGESRPFKRFTYFNNARYLKAILDNERINSAVLIGQSMGGFVSQTFIKYYPEMVEAFVAIDTCPLGNNYYSQPDQWLLRQSGKMARGIPESSLRESIASSCTQTPESYQSFYKTLKTYSKDEICNLMNLGFGGFLDENCDIDITCPTVILVGENDKMGKVMEYSKVWSNKEHFPLVIIPNASHNANYDNSERVNYEIDSLLRALE